MYKFQILAIAALLTFSNNAQAENATDGETLKVQNGVTVKAAPKSEEESDIKYEYPGSPKPLFVPEKPAVVKKEEEVAKPAAEAPAEKKEETIRMQPIIPKGVVAKPVTPKAAEPKEAKVESKPVISQPSPFKKSQDATVKETVKKPEPKAEVVSKPLAAPAAVKQAEEPKENLSAELEKIDKMKPGAEVAEPKKSTNVEPTIGESGLPIPRFVSLKSGEINARTGPGENYPIRWVYQRKNLPVEITAEFKLWRRIKDFDGEQSWTHQAMLSSRRYAIVQHDATVQSEADGSGSPVARFKRGVQVKVSECKGDSCQVEYGNLEGWLKKKDLWGIYPADQFN